MQHNYFLYFMCGYLVIAAASEKLKLYICTLHFSATTFGFYMLVKPRGKISLSSNVLLDYFTQTNMQLMFSGHFINIHFERIRHYAAYTR